ncbi:MAG: hypothetical protein ACXVI1_11245, partial [Halobacteriota archaeon]
ITELHGLKPNEKSLNRAKRYKVSLETVNRLQKPSRGGVAWLSYGPVDALFENKAQNKLILIYNIFATPGNDSINIPLAETSSAPQIHTTISSEANKSDGVQAPLQQSSCSNSNNLSSLELTYSKEELISYTEFRKAGVSKGSVPWLNRASKRFWDTSQGKISKTNIDALRTYTVAHYADTNAKRKVLNFAKAFLKYLATTHFDPRYHAFELFLEMPKALKERKMVTERIVTTQDVKGVLSAIKQDYEEGKLNKRQYRNFTALVLFGAFTGQRPYATIRRLTVGQFRQALAKTPPVLEVLAEQDKIRMQHYVPLHPQVVDALLPLVNNKRDEKAMFTHEAFDDWLRSRKIPLSRVNTHFVCSDLRKFAEQHGDVIGWEQSNRAYILTHGVSGVEWMHYKHPLPEFVYDTYLRYWSDVFFKY